MPLPACRSIVLATGSVLPERIVTNEALAPRVGLSPSAIEARTGIRCRRWAAPTQATSDLAIRAAEEALKQSGIDGRDLDAVILSTTSPDYFFPSTACLVQRALKAGRAVAFDVAASCTGFLAALSAGDQMIRTGTARRVLVIAAEIKSRSLDPADPSTAILFGDGAGAVLLAAGDATSPDGPGLRAIRLGADGSGAGLIHLPAGGSRQPTSPGTLTANLHTMRMNGPAVYRRAVMTLARAVRAHMEETGLTVRDVAHALFHQANRRLLDQVARRLGLTSRQCFSTIADTGNTSSASLPIALDQAARQGCLRDGDLLLLAAFGGGLTWGTALLRWGAGPAAGQTSDR
ncbi:MAG TPA: beta-ketoacyl-ACP synthase III [Nitrospiria bacterium]|nr:beta-ketoacyl-ACP synthase III [Nitrospiria bacterium]